MCEIEDIYNWFCNPILYNSVYNKKMDCFLKKVLCNWNSNQIPSLFVLLNSRNRIADKLGEHIKYIKNKANESVCVVNYNDIFTEYRIIAMKFNDKIPCFLKMLKNVENLVIVDFDVFGENIPYCLFEVIEPLLKFRAKEKKNTLLILNTGDILKSTKDYVKLKDFLFRNRYSCYVDVNLIDENDIETDEIVEEEEGFTEL